MAQALYRKYRSRSLREVVGQENIVEALTRALQTKKISHAYLFTGPRGVGKTTIARIMAHEVNGLNYDSDNLPIDIIEIDAASNRRIDEVRDLREKVKIAPVQSKYKVYIIDEVHMLTNEAFNALLKTLEEPPEHVIFILATTDAHKIPETILSRTQRYNFKLAQKDQVVKLLKDIASKEDISIDSSALEIIANQSGGSLRDALSLLDQIRHSSAPVITEQEALEILGLASQQQIDELVNKLDTNKLPDAVTIIDDLRSKNISPAQISILLAEAYRHKLLANSSLSKNEKVVTELLDRLMLVEQSSRPELALQIALINFIIDYHGSHQQTNTKDKRAQLSALASQPSLTISKPALEPKKSKEPKPEMVSTVDKTILDEALWKTILEDLRNTHNTLYSVLRMSKLDTQSLSDGVINLEFVFPFHQKRMSDSKNQQIILEKLSAHGCQGYEIACMVNSSKGHTVNDLEPFSVNSTEPTNISESDSNLSNIKDIFGSVEVLK